MPAGIIYIVIGNLKLRKDMSDAQSDHIFILKALYGHLNKIIKALMSMA